MNIGLPDEPTDGNLKRVLGAMMPYYESPSEFSELVDAWSLKVCFQDEFCKTLMEAEAQGCVIVLESPDGS